MMHSMAIAAAPPSGSDVVASSNVVWTDPTWANDGTGAMPIGNGDITSSVWVEDTTGDLRLLLSKSDVFDENSQPVKTGVLRFHFEPPLWAGAAPAPPPPKCKGAAPLGSFFANKSKGSSVSTIGDQKNHLAIPSAASWTGCSTPAAWCACCCCCS